jgi:hypothetical protein
LVFCRVHIRFYGADPLYQAIQLTAGT